MLRVFRKSFGVLYRCFIQSIWFHIGVVLNTLIFISYFNDRQSFGPAVGVYYERLYLDLVVEVVRDGLISEQVLRSLCDCQVLVRKRVWYESNLGFHLSYLVIDIAEVVYSVFLLRWHSRELSCLL